MKSKIILNIIFIQTFFLGFSQEKKVITATDNIFIQGQCTCSTLSGKKYIANYVYQGKFQLKAIFRKEKYIENNYKINTSGDITGSITKFEIDGIDMNEAGIQVPFSANSAISNWNIGSNYGYKITFSKGIKYITIYPKDNKNGAGGYYVKEVVDKVAKKLNFEYDGFKNLDVNVYVNDIDERDINENQTFVSACMKLLKYLQKKEAKEEVKEKLDDENNDNDDKIIDDEDDFLSKNYKDPDDFLENDNTKEEKDNDFLNENYEINKKNYLSDKYKSSDDFLAFYGDLKRFSEYKNNEVKYGYKNEDGEVVIMPVFDEVEDFNEGLAIVTYKTAKDKKQAVINKNGQLVIPFGKYNYSHDFFSEGMCAVYKNGKNGFIDAKGKLIIPYKYDNAWENFKNGIVKVSNYTGKSRETKPSNLKPGQVFISQTIHQRHWFIINKKGDILDNGFNF